MAKQNSGSSALRAFGGGELSTVSWPPSASANQTLTEAFGVEKVTRTGPGVYVLTLATRYARLWALPSYVSTDNTNLHNVRVIATNPTARTVTVEHRSGTGAVGTLSDSLDLLSVVIIGQYL